jgi:plasmid stabilization system protein ParE
MSRYQFTPEASEDLFEIWSYIAGDDPKAADRVEDAIHAACGLLADNPLIGSIRMELTGLPLRFWVVRPFRNYWIVYDPDAKPLRIIRVLHAAREVFRLLR